MNNDALRALDTDELTRQFHEYRSYTFDSSGMAYSAALLPEP
jgi:hypothetical protein